MFCKRQASHLISVCVLPESCSKSQTDHHEVMSVGSTHSQHPQPNNLDYTTIFEPPTVVVYEAKLL